MAIILLNVCVFERKNTVFLGYIVFIYVCTFLGYQIGLKSVFFLGLGSTFGPPPGHIFPGVPPLGIMGGEIRIFSVYCILLLFPAPLLIICVEKL